VKLGTFVILNRNDLCKGAENKVIDEIKLSDFSVNQSVIMKSGIIIFIDDNNEYIFLKSRYF
jgi:hypothetical protein